MRWPGLIALTLALIIVPFLLFEDALTVWAEALVAEDNAQLAIAGGVVLALTLDVFLPIPSSIVALAAGALLPFGWALASIWAGYCLSCAVGYELGVRLPVEENARAEALFERWGAWAVVISRPAPVLAEATAILAGAGRMSRQTFYLTTAAANLVMAGIYTFFGSGLV